METFFILGMMLLMIASMWKIFDKADQAGWASIVPIYNIVVLLRIVGKPTWWLLLLFVPLVNFIVIIILVNRLSQAFGKSTGFTIGLILLGVIFYPILAFGDSEYTPLEEDND